jgi:hypothetical protein
MRLSLRPALLAAPLAFATALPLAAQNDGAPRQLDGESRNGVIEAIAAELERAYVFPDVAARMSADLRARLRAGEYEPVTERADFAARLTADLQAISNDRHLRVRAGPGQGAFAPASARPSADQAFGQVEMLEGNIGYVEIRSFAFPAEAVRTVTRDAMTRIADADALIIDVRANGGGNPEFVALVSSYLFDDEPVHLNSLFFRPSNDTTHFFTNPDVEGIRFGGRKPVYVLTSPSTFSAAEEFTYNLQARGRATIIGETTGGGAHPGGVRSLPEGMSLFVPSGRAINPITKTNWEGTGIAPDIRVPAEGALDEALRHARQPRA